MPHLPTHLLAEPACLPLCLPRATVETCLSSWRASLGNILSFGTRAVYKQSDQEVVKLSKVGNVGEFKLFCAPNEGNVDLAAHFPSLSLHPTAIYSTGGCYNSSAILIPELWVIRKVCSCR